MIGDYGVATLPGVLLVPVHCLDEHSRTMAFLFPATGRPRSVVKRRLASSTSSRTAVGRPGLHRSRSPGRRCLALLCRRAHPYHPRCDPDMHLEQLSNGPIGLGTRIRRVNTRWGTPVEGEMEVVELDPERAFAVSIHDRNMDAQGRTTFEAREPARTLVTVTTGIEGIDDPEKVDFLTRMMQR